MQKNTVNFEKMINKNIFRAYDIRGIAHKPFTSNNPDLTPESVYLIGKASGTYFQTVVCPDKKNPLIAVGYDVRVSNPELSDAFINGLKSTGCDILNIGLVPTPMLYFAVCKLNLDGGACITASHNPKEYNGIKLVAKNAHSICGDELQEIYKLAVGNVFHEADEGKIESKNVFELYKTHISQLIQPKRKLKIVIDAGNGVTGPFVKDFFEAFNCEVIPLYTEPDGLFPNHEANPEEEENMHDLMDAVKKHNADLGMGFDGDGDRIGIVDEKGKHYSADLMLLLLARDVLSRNKNAKIVFDVKVSQVLIDDIASHGGEPVMTKTGHSFIESKMHEISALLGGEISGHMFFAENYYGFDDAFFAGAKILEILASQDLPFSDLLKDIPLTATTPELKSPCPDDKKFQIMDKLAKIFQSKYSCTTIDGVRIHFDEKSWGAIRCSNTSPNMTIRFEAPNQELLKQIMRLMLDELRQFPEIDLWWENQAN